MKLLIITNIPNPYRVPLFNELHQTLVEQGHELLVAFGAETYHRRKFILNKNDFQFPYTILKSNKVLIKKKEGVILTYGGLLGTIRSYNPDKIIVSGFSIATCKLYLLSLLSKHHYYIWSGIIHSAGRKQLKIQQLLRGILTRRAKGGIAYGTHSKNYLIDLGIPKSKIHIAINTVDTQYFAEETKKIRARTKSTTAVKKLLYIGYLTQGKRIDLIFNAIALLAGKRTDFRLQIVGDGPETVNLKRAASNLGIENLVEFTGFIQKQDIPNYLSDAYAFLFASEYDIWGLVLVEAMAAGVPCIASVKAGATCDLVEHEKNGFVANYDDAYAITDTINSLLSKPQMQYSLSKAASQYIQQNVSIHNSINGFMEVVNEL